MSILGHYGLLLGQTSDDPYAAYRVTVANLNVDLSDPKRTWTAHGDAAVSGGWLTLDGTGDYIDTPESEDFDFGTGDFCWEAFATISASPGGYVPVIAKWKTGALSYYLGINTTRHLCLFARVGGGNYFVDATTTAIPVDTDTHLAWYRIGNDFYVAVGGVVQSILSQAGAIENTSQPASVGAQSDGSNPFTGLIRGVRATKGSSGGYGASNFTPPSFPLPTS